MPTLDEVAAAEAIRAAAFAAAGAVDYNKPKPAGSNDIHGPNGEVIGLAAGLTTNSQGQVVPVGSLEYNPAISQFVPVGTPQSPTPAVDTTTDFNAGGVPSDTPPLAPESGGTGASTPGYSGYVIPTNPITTPSGLTVPTGYVGFDYQPSSNSFVPAAAAPTTPVAITSGGGLSGSDKYMSAAESEALSPFSPGGAKITPTEMGAVVGSYTGSAGKANPSMGAGFVASLGYNPDIIAQRTQTPSLGLNSAKNIAAYYASQYAVMDQATAQKAVSEGYTGSIFSYNPINASPLNPLGITMNNPIAGTGNYVNVNLPTGRNLVLPSLSISGIQVGENAPIVPLGSPIGAVGSNTIFGSVTPLAASPLAIPGTGMYVIGNARNQPLMISPPTITENYIPSPISLAISNETRRLGLDITGSPSNIPLDPTFATLYAASNFLFPSTKQTIVTTKITAPLSYFNMNMQNPETGKPYSPDTIFTVTNGGSTFERVPGGLEAGVIGGSQKLGWIPSSTKTPLVVNNYLSSDIDQLRASNNTGGTPFFVNKPVEDAVYITAGLSAFGLGIAQSIGGFTNKVDEVNPLRGTPLDVQYNAANFFVGGLANMVPFVLSVPGAVEFSMRSPGAVPSKVVSVGSDMISGIITTEMKSPGSSVGTIAGMYVGGKVMDLGLGYINPIKSATALTGEYVINPTYTTMSKIPVVGDYLTEAANIPKLVPESTRFTYVGGKIPFTDSEAFLGYARGPRVESTIFATRGTVNELLAQTEPHMPGGFDVRNPYVWSKGDIQIMEPFFRETASTPEQLQLMNIGFNMRELIGSSQKQLSILYEQNQPVGTATQTGVSAETTANMMSAVSRGGERTIVVGSRSQLDLVGEPYMRDLSGSDYDLTASISNIRNLYPDLKTVFSNAPEDIIWNDAAKRVSQNIPKNEWVDFGFAGQDHLIGAQPLEMHTDVRGMPATTVNGETIYISTPEYAISSKLSRWFGGYKYDANTGVSTVITGGSKQLADISDIYSVSRYISKTAYQNNLFELGAGYEGVSNAVRDYGTSIGKVKGEMLEDILPSGDILEGANRNPNARTINGVIYHEVGRNYAGLDLRVLFEKPKSIRDVSWEELDEYAKENKPIELPSGQPINPWNIKDVLNPEFSRQPVEIGVSRDMTTGELKNIFVGAEGEVIIPGGKVAGMDVIHFHTPEPGNPDFVSDVLSPADVGGTLWGIGGPERWQNPAFKMGAMIEDFTTGYKVGTIETVIRGKELTAVGAKGWIDKFNREYMGFAEGETEISFDRLISEPKYAQTVESSPNARSTARLLDYVQKDVGSNKFLNPDFNLMDYSNENPGYKLRVGEEQANSIRETQAEMARNPEAPFEIQRTQFIADKYGIHFIEDRRIGKPIEITSPDYNGGGAFLNRFSVDITKATLEPTTAKTTFGRGSNAYLGYYPSGIAELGSNPIIYPIPIASYRNTTNYPTTVLFGERSTTYVEPLLTQLTNNNTVYGASVISGGSSENYPMVGIVFDTYSSPVINKLIENYPSPTNYTNNYPTITNNYPEITITPPGYPTLYPPTEYPPGYPTYTPTAKYPPYTPPYNPPPYTPPPVLITPPITPPKFTQLTEWHEKKRRRPARFEEEFSFELTEDTPIPIRFGLGGYSQKAMAKNPHAQFIPGYRGTPLARGIPASDVAPNTSNPFYEESPKGNLRQRLPEFQLPADTLQQKKPTNGKSLEGFKGIFGKRKGRGLMGGDRL